MTETSHTLIVEEDEDSGDLFLTFPPEVLKALDWEIDTQLEWVPLDDNRWSIQKVKPKK